MTAQLIWPHKPDDPLLGVGQELLSEAVTTAALAWLQNPGANTAATCLPLPCLFPC